MRGSSAPAGPMTTILLVEDDPLQASFTMSLLGRNLATCAVRPMPQRHFVWSNNRSSLKKLGLVISGHHTPGSRAGLRGRTARPHAALPVLVLGAPDDSPDDYTDEHVAFLPPALLPQNRCWP